MAVQMQFDWDLLKPEKELTDAQQSLAREICETYLDTGAAVPGHQKKVQLGKSRNLLNELAQLGRVARPRIFCSHDGEVGWEDILVRVTVRGR